MSGLVGCQGSNLGFDRMRLSALTAHQTRHSLATHQGKPPTMNQAPASVGPDGKRWEG